MLERWWVQKWVYFLLFHAVGTYFNIFFCSWSTPLIPEYLFPVCGIPGNLMTSNYLSCIDNYVHILISYKNILMRLSYEDNTHVKWSTYWHRCGFYNPQQPLVVTGENCSQPYIFPEAVIETYYYMPSIRLPTHGQGWLTRTTNRHVP